MKFDSKVTIIRVVNKNILFDDYFCSLILVPVPYFSKKSNF